MFKGLLVTLLLVVLFAQVAMADVELEVTTNKDECVLVGGSTTVTVSVTNTNDTKDANGIKVVVSGPSSLTYSPSSKTLDIAAGKTEKYEVRIRGDLNNSASVTITAGDKSGADYDIDGDSTKIKVRPPELEMELITPKDEITWVVDNAKIPQTTEFDVSVKNVGEDKITGLTLTLDSDETKISCTTPTPKQNINAAELVKYEVTCENVTNGDRFTMRFGDSSGEVKDIEAIDIRLVESFKLKKLEISSPMENQEFIIGQYGEDIDVTVKNTGEVDFRGVCVTVENMEFTADDCVDLTVGAENTFTLGIVPEQDTGNVRIVTEDSDGQASDQVIIRVIKRESIGAPIIENDTPENTSEVVNITTPTNETPIQNTTDDGTIFGIPSWIFTLVLIIVPIVVLVFYIRAGIARAE